MKQITKFLIIAAVMLSFTAATFAQVSATALATATVVSPLTITRTADLNFGNVIQTVPANPSTVILDPATGTASYTNATASAIPAASAAITRATFTVTGTPGASYSISILPATLTLTGPGANTMTATNFQSNPSTPGTLTGGTSTLYIGAQLNLIANQAGGTYTSGNFTVTVNYQ
jgi:hypothetical protein